MTINTDAKQPEKQTQSELKFLIQRLYLKDLSFEAPHVPAMFQQQWQPALSLDVHTSHTQLDKDIYEVVLHLTATVQNEKQVAFLVEVKQAGIFSIQGSESSDQLGHLLGSFCPNILFPYAREVITAEVTRASFPQLVLAPINFDALYFQNLQAAKQKEEANQAKEDLH